MTQTLSESQDISWVPSVLTVVTVDQFAAYTLNWFDSRLLVGFRLSIVRIQTESVLSGLIYPTTAAFFYCWLEES